MNNFPTVKVAAVAREFQIPRLRLTRRLNGIPLKKGRPVSNTKFLIPKKKVLYRYINRLDNINLTVRANFVTDVINYIL